MATETVKTEVGSYFISNYPPYSQWSDEALPEVDNALHAPPGDTAARAVPAHSVLPQTLQVLLLPRVHR